MNEKRDNQRGRGAARQCGECQLCCRLLPVEEFNKPALTRCSYQRHGKGCSIYAGRPISCRLWSCRWLVNDDMGDQSRPDRSGIVVDMMPDLIKIDGQTFPVIVVWLDRDRPLAYRDAAFRRYVERQDTPVLVRVGSKGGGTVLFPSKLTGGRGLIEQPSELGSDMPVTLQQKAAALGATLAFNVEDGATPATLTLPDGSTITVAARGRQ